MNNLENQGGVNKSVINWYHGQYDESCSSDERRYKINRFGNRIT